MPQFWLSPLTPKVSATIEGKTPNRKPYARPEVPETRLSRLGFATDTAKIWARAKTELAATRHQTRFACRTLIRKSDPTPESKCKTCAQRF